MSKQHGKGRGEEQAACVRELAQQQFAFLAEHAGSPPSSCPAHAASHSLHSVGHISQSLLLRAQTEDREAATISSVHRPE